MSVSVHSLIASNVKSLLIGADNEEPEERPPGKRRRRGAPGAAGVADLDADVLNALEIDDVSLDGPGDEQLLDELVDQEVGVDDDDESDDASMLSVLDAQVAECSEPINESQLALLRAALGQMPQVDHDKRREYKRARKRRRRSRRQLNYGMTALTAPIEVPLYKPDAWIYDRSAALSVSNEDACAQQLVLSRIAPNTPSIPPRRGMRRMRQPPVSLAHACFEEWMRYTTTCLYTTNVVATFNLGHQVNVSGIVNRLAGVSFNPLCFAAAKLRCQRATHLIFSGGAVVCAGANSPEMARIACVECALILNRVAIMAEVRNFSLQNVVSTADAGFEVDLFELAKSYAINAHYDPECFPGLTFRLTTSQLVFIVFKSGKCIITGVSSRTDSLLAWRWFHSCVLWEFEMHLAAQHEDEADYRRRRRRESSIIEPMCESVRDLTVAHITRLMNSNETNSSVRRIYEEVTKPGDVPLSHFDEVVALGKSIGATDEPIDAWLAKQNDERLEEELPIAVRERLTELVS